MKHVEIVCVTSQRHFPQSSSILFVYLWHDCYWNLLIGQKKQCPWNPLLIMLFSVSNHFQPSKRLKSEEFFGKVLSFNSSGSSSALSYILVWFLRHLFPFTDLSRIQRKYQIVIRSRKTWGTIYGLGYPFVCLFMTLRLNWYHDVTLADEGTNRAVFGIVAVQ